MRYLVQEGCIQPLCDLLGSSDAKIVPVALDALDNILKVRCDHLLFEMKSLLHCFVPVSCSKFCLELFVRENSGSIQSS